ncbi:MAG: hypothetical protein EP346_06840 [Bacteroidetes bacterium]|nr:MAG: hypothetical protein EP346_06840 [Bacteroidota bacterium]
MKTCYTCGTRIKIISGGKLQTKEEVCYNCMTQITKELNTTRISRVSGEEAMKAINTVNGRKNLSSENQSNVIAMISSLDIPAVKLLLKRKEIKELPNVLHDQEQILHMIQGIYSGGIGILVLTNKRMIFVDKGMMYGLKVEEFPLANINSVTFESGLLMGKVKIHSSGNGAEISNVDKDAARHFADYYSRMKHSESTASSSDSNPTVDVIGQIERLAELRDKGIITPEDFESQKQKMLEKL